MRQPPPGVVTRTYRADDEYARDAASMAAAGWYVASARRAPDGAIIATYAYGPQTPYAPASVPMGSNTANAPRGVGAWLARQPSQVRTGIVIGVVAMVLICGLVAMALGGNVQSRTVTIGVGDSPTATPTIADEATVTPAPATVTGTRLGGPMSAFDDALGPEQGTGQWKGVWDTTLSGQQVEISVQNSAGTAGTSDLITTPDGIDRVFSVSVDYTGSAPLTAAQMATICAQFLPPDAKHISDKPVAGFPTEHIYRSQLLAASFDTNAFQNGAGAEASPGTFSVMYDTQTCMVNTGQN